MLQSVDPQLGATSMGQLGRTQKSQAVLEKKLKAHACELEQKLKARTRELAEARRDLAEALKQQVATSEVLGIISSSPGELQPVFQTMLENATRLCEADSAVLVLREGGDFRFVATYNAPAALLEQTKRDPLFRPGPASGLGRSIRLKQVDQVPDIANDQAYFDGEPARVRVVEAGYRSQLSVPLIKHDEAIGGVCISRQKTGLFTERQIELVSNFANHAVIAIENARLLSELRESLRQQTATADVLKVISRSTFDLRAVLDTLVESATKLCEADLGNIARPKGDGTFWQQASYGMSPAHKEYMESIPFKAERGSAIGRALLERAPIQIPDGQTDPDYQLAAPKIFGFHTMLAVPLMREGTPIGVFSLARRSVHPFSDRQIELLTTFADQAVIAIENVRLFEEVQARTGELSASLQQQTATADVLKIISRSTFDLKSVLQTLVESAGRLCGADYATITRQKDGVLFFAEAYGYSSELIEYVKAMPVERGRGTATGRALLEGRVIHIADVLADPDYTWAEAQRLGGYRTVLGVPMLREGIPTGVLTLTRSEVRPFTEKQIELVSTFADQAAIAIENVRLFDEIRDKSRQLETASLHKSQFLANMSHELRTPLNAILGYNELILNNVYGETAGRMSAVLTRIQSNGRHLLRLINDVLDLSKIEAGQLTLSLADYSIKQVVHSVRAAVEPLAIEKRLAFKVKVPRDLPPGCGDERRLTQALLNLVSNAIKFTDVGEVAIKVSAANGAFTLSVRDTGPGIDPADQVRIFEEFQQADSSVTKKKGGTGLGLSIARHIIEMHGGRIWVESRVGNGTTFFFTVPVRAGQQVGRA
jgi:signal transduction histidine kinase